MDYEAIRENKMALITGAVRLMGLLCPLFCSHACSQLLDCSEPIIMEMWFQKIRRPGISVSSQNTPSSPGFIPLKTLLFLSSYTRGSDFCFRLFICMKLNCLLVAQYTYTGHETFTYMKKNVRNMVKA